MPLQLDAGAAAARIDEHAAAVAPGGYGAFDRATSSFLGLPAGVTTRPGFFVNESAGAGPARSHKATCALYARPSRGRAGVGSAHHRRWFFGWWGEEFVRTDVRDPEGGYLWAWRKVYPDWYRIVLRIRLAATLAWYGAWWHRFVDADAWYIPLSLAWTIAGIVHRRGEQS